MKDNVRMHQKIKCFKNTKKIFHLTFYARFMDKLWLHHGIFRRIGTLKGSKRYNWSLSQLPNPIEVLVIRRRALE